MDRNTKILILCLVLFFGISIAAKYYVFFVEQNYLVTAEADCDPGIESCFVWDCTVEEDADCDQYPYKYIEISAAHISDCNPYEEECEPLNCTPNDEYCDITYCSDETSGDDEFCLYTGT